MLDLLIFTPYVLPVYYIAVYSFYSCYGCYGYDGYYGCYGCYGCHGCHGYGLIIWSEQTSNRTTSENAS